MIIEWQYKIKDSETRCYNTCILYWLYCRWRYQKISNHFRVSITCSFKSPRQSSADVRIKIELNKFHILCFQNPALSESQENNCGETNKYPQGNWRSLLGTALEQRVHAEVSGNKLLLGHLSRGTIISVGFWPALAVVYWERKIIVFGNCRVFVIKWFHIHKEPIRCQ